jgi:hypothetical protein
MGRLLRLAPIFKSTHFQIIKLKTLFTIILALTVWAGMAQRAAKPPHQLKKADTVCYRYWLYTAVFKVDSGCENSTTGSIKREGLGVPTFDEMKSYVAKWVFPYRLTEFEVISLKETTIDKMLTKSDTFKYRPVKPWVFRLDTTGLSVCDTCKITLSPDLWSKSVKDGFKPDTVPVLAYCCTAAKKMKFKWLKMYGITFNTTIFNNLKIYGAYLMPDRKTKAIYRVIYSIDQ